MEVTCENFAMITKEKGIVRSSSEDLGGADSKLDTRKCPVRSSHVQSAGQAGCAGSVVLDARGDIRGRLRRRAGVSFDQRNARLDQGGSQERPRQVPVPLEADPEQARGDKTRGRGGHPGPGGPGDGAAQPSGAQVRGHVRQGRRGGAAAAPHGKEGRGRGREAIGRGQGATGEPAGAADALRAAAEAARGAARRPGGAQGDHRRPGAEQRGAQGGVGRPKSRGAGPHQR